MRRFIESALALVVAVVCSIPGQAQCGFSSKPVADFSWYRNAGWQTPGISDAKSIRHINLIFNGQPMTLPDGLTVSLVEHPKNYRVHFPASIFDQNGTRMRMMPASMRLEKLLRWEKDGRPYAYSYMLVPDHLLCFFTVDLIDDKGDGKFRVMTSPGHTMFSQNGMAPAIPEWLRRPIS